MIMRDETRDRTRGIEMKISTLLLVGTAFLLAMAALALSASAECTSCAKEGDWSQSASAFLEGKPISEEPVEFGPKAVRKTESQFEKPADDQSAAKSVADAGANSAATASAAKLILKSVNATPALVNSNSSVRIAATFALNGSMETENETQVLLTATASIKDSTGKEAAKLSLIRSSGNEYYQDWTASVPAGIYRVDIAASSLQGSESFPQALQIEVAGLGNVTESAPAA